ncbi:MAG: hypothetical protein RMZ69_29515 [Nostoc sp. ChiQUE01a]|nr:hypothetical protein [Nostoc sp. DedQUE12a]MDZ8241247.1 hypothetical protein [Nostoc sp. ChiQUE01a]
MHSIVLGYFFLFAVYPKAIAWVVLPVLSATHTGLSYLNNTDRL